MFACFACTRKIIVLLSLSCGFEPGLISVFFHLQIVTAQAFWLSISGVLVVLLTGALSASNLSCNCARRGGASSQALLF
jgi:hypothetical protein